MIYKLATLKDMEFNIERKLSDKEYQDLLTHIKNLMTFNKDYKRLNIVINEMKSFRNFIDTYKKEEISYRKFSDDINSYILKYLASFKSFLDHWETYINRLYGKDSKELKDFKKATAIEFDGYFSYRFIYELRNYTLHCDMPVSKVVSKLDENDNHIINISIDRDRLLTTYKWPKKVGLESMKESFDIRPLMEESLKCLERIQKVSINLFDTKKVFESALVVFKLRVDYPGKKEFSIVKFPSDNPRTPTSIESIPIVWAEFLVKMLVEK